VAFPPAEHLLAERAHHHHRDVAHADRLADDLARWKERGPGLGAEQRDRAALGALLGGERSPALDAVPVERKVVTVDATHLPILVGIGRADPAAGDFLLRRPLDGPGVEELRLLAVLAPEAEVRRFERRGRAVLDRRRLLHHQAVHAPELRPALVGSPALAVRDREPAEDRRHPEHDANRLQARASEVLPDLDPGLDEPLAEGAGTLHAACASGSTTRPSRSSTRRSANEAICGSWVTRTTLLPWRCSSLKSPRTSSPVRESRAPVGSSASRSAGRLARARAMATLWRWPPESWAG